MNNLKIFENSEFGKIRVEIINDEPWFAGKDVASALGYSRERDALQRHVDQEDAVKRGSLTEGGIQEMIFINESGLYSLILGSKLESAKRFKKWVTSEVLPSIRKTGLYSLTPITYLDALKALVEKEEERLKLEAENNQLRFETISKGSEISNLEESLRIQGYKLDKKLVRLEDVPDYTSTSIRRAYTSYDYEYSYLCMGKLTEYFGYEVYWIEARRLKTQRIYPIVLFELVEYISDKYWNEISSDGINWDLKDFELAEFIISKVKEEGLDSKYRNK